MLVAGQQARMLAGADVWGHPVAYDKLGVRYRRWRNSVASPDPQARALFWPRTSWPAEPRITSLPQNLICTSSF